MSEPGDEAEALARALDAEARELPFCERIMRLPPGAGARRETTSQRDARSRGESRFNAFGCK